MTHDTVEAYPLHWPDGIRRTKRPERSRFGVSFAVARDSMVEELERLGGRRIIVSTNIPSRRDGLPYANTKEPDDSGVAVYFKHKGNPTCFSCDTWNRVQDNFRAIGKTVEAMRGIERWGVGDFIERAFRGFQALPAPMVAARSWREVMGVEDCPDDSLGLEVLRETYHLLAKICHPDAGGTNEEMAELNAAWEQAKGELAQ